MKVSHYFEWEDLITGGHLQSVKNQRKVMERRGIDYTTEPDLDADILHLNNMGPKSIYYAKRAQMKGVPVVIHTHQTAEDFRDSFALSNLIARPMKPYLEYAYSLADHLVCPSEYNRQTIEDYTDSPKTVISNGFDRDKLEGFEDLREEYLERYDLEPPVIFMVGHVIERKGLDTFIETAEEMPELDFAWFGYVNPTGGRFGKYLQSRETLEKIKEAPDNCQFTGYIEDIRGAFAAGDIFFFPTRNENEGIALLEAMGTGKPPVVRDIETFEWMENGKECLKAGEDFTGALEKMKEPELRERIGENAREKSEEFNLESVGDELVALYEELV
ncbi:MAG: glycosyltransferase family 4 protein [Candidatus Nanohaloarchaea archaeon]